MIRDKFIVKIPLNETEFKEVRFKSREEVCEFLEIGMYTLNSFLNGRLKMKHMEGKKLRGISIERIILKEKINVEQNIIDYQNRIISKIK